MPCGDLSLGACSALAMPGVVVHRVEGDATTLHGSFTFGTYGAGSSENRESGEVVPTMDSSTADMEQRSEMIQLGDLDRCAAV